MDSVTILIICDLCKMQVAKGESCDPIINIMRLADEIMKKHLSSCETNRFTVYEARHLLNVEPTSESYTQ